MTGRDDYNKIGGGSGSNNGNSGYGPENLDDDSVRGKGGKNKSKPIFATPWG